MTTSIIIRCDGAALPEIGTGHVIRMMGLAKKIVEIYPNIKDRICFITRSDKEYSLGFGLLASSGFRLTVAGNELAWNSKSELEILKNHNARLIIVDRLDCDPKWMLELKKSGAQIVTFDDCGSTESLADVAINAILSAQDSKHAFSGYDYLLLSTKDLIGSYKFKKKVSKVIATFGGFDYRNLNEFFLNSLINFGKNIKTKGTIKIEIIVGHGVSLSDNLWTSKVNLIKKQGCFEINLLKSPNDFYKKILEADILITAGGLTVFEALSMGIPTIALPQYEHQLKTIQYLAKLGGVLQGDSEIGLNQQDFMRILSGLINDCQKRLLLSKNGTLLIDGNGVSRVLKIFEPKLKEINN